MFYEIPETLEAELSELSGYFSAFKEGKLDGTTMKARRVPFGCYEQRTDGTYMVRIRATGGAVTPAQLKAIAAISDRYRCDFVHVTTRQEFQIHNLGADDVVPVMRELLSYGLSTRGGGGNTVRNIMVSPRAGVDKDEVFDPTPDALSLTSRLISEADSWLLPRKLKISFSNSAKDDVFSQFTDLGFVARIENGQKGFRVYVAGGFGSKAEMGNLLSPFVPAEEIWLVAEAVKRLFDKYGNRKNRFAARLRFLWKTLGEERFRELYQEELEGVRKQGDAAIFKAPPLDERIEPDFAPYVPTETDFPAWKETFAHEQKQPGFFSILFPTFLGDVKNEDLIRLADAVAPFGLHTIRASTGQNLLIRNIPERFLGNVWKALEGYAGWRVASPLANAIACTGASTCKLGICLPKGALGAIARRLEKSGAAATLTSFSDFRLNISGCGNSCGQHPLADLGFFGFAGRKDRLYPGYTVVAGAKTGLDDARMARLIGHVSARDLPLLTEKLLLLWNEKRASFSGFADFLDQGGEEEIRKIIETFKDIPDFEDDKNYYYDWGSEEAFSLVGRGVGECSAGLFDLIEVDLKQARSALEKARSQPSAETVFHVVLPAARALLVTRGVETNTDEGALTAFRRHFIDTGLVDQGFAPLLAAAIQKDEAALADLLDKAAALLFAIEDLYQAMDNSLRFPAEAVQKPEAQSISAAKPDAETKADIERDYRTVSCPMNFVKVKFDLETLDQGQKLKVILADGDPIRNVPRSVAEEGHKILKQEQHGDIWEVLIEKTGS